MHPVTLCRNKSCEDKNVHLWYEAENVIASVVGAQGDCRVKITSPNGSLEYGMVFADVNKVQENIAGYQRTVTKGLKELGFNATFSEPVTEKPVLPKELIEQYEKAITLGKLKAYSNISLERPLTDSEHKEAMNLALKCGIKL